MATTVHYGLDVLRKTLIHMSDIYAATAGSGKILARRPRIRFLSTLIYAPGIFILLSAYSSITAAVMRLAVASPGYKQALLGCLRSWVGPP